MVKATSLQLKSAHFAMDMWHAFTGACLNQTPASCRYVSNTKIKFLLVLADPVPKDDELRMVGTALLPVSFRNTIFAYLLLRTLSFKYGNPLTCGSRQSQFGHFLVCWGVLPPKLLVSNATSLCVQIFRRFHAAYVDAVSNPFYTTNTVWCLSSWGTFAADLVARGVMATRSGCLHDTEMEAAGLLEAERRRLLQDF